MAKLPKPTATRPPPAPLPLLPKTPRTVALAQLLARISREDMQKKAA